ncbi:sugar phosphate isomerase/epimerase [Clostridiales Family XIII bacterium PM5-7]
MNTERIYVATFSEDAVNVIRQHKVNIELNHLCISEHLNEDKIQGTLAEMNADVDASGAKGIIVHGPFTELAPGSIDLRAVQLMTDRLNEAYQVCCALKVKRMVVHSGYIPLLYHKGWHQDRSLEFWPKFMADKPEDFQLLIENVFEDEPHMMKKLVEGIGDSRVKLCLDVGHANAMTCPDLNVLDWIRILGKDVSHLHIHNNDGKNDLHRPLMDGSLNMEAVLAAIDEFCGADTTMTIESSTCATSVEWLLNQK